MSRLIASLEIEIDGMLFERTSRRVRVTPLGERLRDRLSAAIALLETGLEETRAMARGSTGSLVSASRQPAPRPAALERLHLVVAARTTLPPAQ